jgi:hypothetical protein
MNRRIWTREENAFLRRCYADTLTEKLAHALQRSKGKVYQHAAKMGLKKSVEFLGSAEAKRLSGLHSNSIAHRFQKGIIPHNKGTRRPGWSVGRMAETQFKKGHRPHTWRPVGSTRLDDDGYLLRKISDTGYSPRDWRPVHHLLWQEAYGPLPSSYTHALIFKDGDKTHIALDNLELISRADLMRRNTIHNLPAELVEVIQLKGSIKRVITCKRRNHDSSQESHHAEELDSGPAQPPLRDARSA